MRVLLLLALVAAAQANIGSIKLECPASEGEGEEWEMYRGNHEATCMRVMKEKKSFDEAFETCGKLEASLVSFTHNKEKIEFFNKLVIQKAGSEATLWFFDKRGMHPKLFDKVPQQDEWLVIKVSEDPSKIELMPNPVKVQRNFVCERPAQPVMQRPKFASEPEDLQISQDVLNEFKEPKGKEPKPLIATFNCRPFGLPKPEVHWVMVSENKQNLTLKVKPIEAKKIVDPKEPLKHTAIDQIAFFDLRRNCDERPCPKNSMQEPSQLIVIGTQLLDPKYTIACVAKNSMGSVMSREAQIIVNEMEHFSEEAEVITVKEGENKTIDCDLETTPDIASVEWLRIIPRKGQRPVEQRLEEINLQTDGGFQMSKSTFELLIDFATVQFSGRYECRVRMHTGRIGHVTRTRAIVLEVEPCKNCDLRKKPLTVAPGYPVSLSMSSKSNKYIREGDDFLMECPCFGKRAPRDTLSVEWDMAPKDPQQLPVQPEGSALLIRDAKKDFAGTYSCRCLRGEEKSDWSSMEISIVPTIAPMKTAEFVEVAIGSEAIMECQLPAVELDGIVVSVTPMLGAGSLMHIAKENDRIQLSASNGRYRIAIKDVRPEDAGNYGCRIHVNYMDAWESIDSFYTTLKVKSE